MESLVENIVTNITIQYLMVATGSAIDPFGMKKKKKVFIVMDYDAYEGVIL